MRINFEEIFMKFRIKYLIFSFILFLVVSCGSTKSVVHQPVKKTGNTAVYSPKNLNSSHSGKSNSMIKSLLKDAEKYLGTPYKLGGTTTAGMDCSGLTTKVFEKYDYILPRRSVEQSEVGDRVDISQVKPGDLLFFATSGGSRVSHVGIVHTIESSGEVKFIHASTSKGVIISSLNEKYWNKAYLHARRIL